MKNVFFKVLDRGKSIFSAGRTASRLRGEKGHPDGGNFEFSPVPIPLSEAGETGEKPAVPVVVSADRCAVHAPAPPAYF